MPLARWRSFKLNRIRDVVSKIIRLVRNQADLI